MDGVWVDSSPNMISQPWAPGLPLGCSDLSPLAPGLSRQLWGLPQDQAGVAVSHPPLRLGKQKPLFSLPAWPPYSPGWEVAGKSATQLCHN